MKIAKSWSANKKFEWKKVRKIKNNLLCRYRKLQPPSLYLVLVFRSWKQPKNKKNTSSFCLFQLEPKNLLFRFQDILTETSLVPCSWNLAVILHAVSLSRPLYILTASTTLSRHSLWALSQPLLALSMLSTTNYQCPDQAVVIPVRPPICVGVCVLLRLCENGVSVLCVHYCTV